MTLQELIIREEKFFDSQGKAVNAQPVGKPLLLRIGLYVSKNMLNEVTIKELKKENNLDANAYVIGDQLSIDQNKSYICPIQFYKLETGE